MQAVCSTSIADSFVFEEHQISLEGVRLLQVLVIHSRHLADLLEGLLPEIEIVLEQILVDILDGANLLLLFEEFAAGLIDFLHDLAAVGLDLGEKLMDTAHELLDLVYLRLALEHLKQPAMVRPFLELEV